MEKELRIDLDAVLTDVCREAEYIGARQDAYDKVNAEEINRELLIPFFNEASSNLKKALRWYIVKDESYNDIDIVLHMMPTADSDALYTLKSEAQLFLKCYVLGQWLKTCGHTLYEQTLAEAESHLGRVKVMLNVRRAPVRRMDCVLPIVECERPNNPNNNDSVVNPKNVYTKEEVDEKMAGKQSLLSTNQMNAVNSTITAAKVAKYEKAATEATEAKSGIAQAAAQATAAADSALGAARYMQELQTSINNLPDGTAVSMRVAQLEMTGEKAIDIILHDETPYNSTHEPEPGNWRAYDKVEVSWISCDGEDSHECSVTLMDTDTRQIESDSWKLPSVGSTVTFVMPSYVCSKHKIVIAKDAFATYSMDSFHIKRISNIERINELESSTKANETLLRNIDGKVNGYTVDKEYVIKNFLSYANSDLPYIIPKGTQVDMTFNIVNGTTHYVYGKKSLEDESGILLVNTTNNSTAQFVAPEDINYIQVGINGVDGAASNSFTIKYEGKGIGESRQSLPSCSVMFNPSLDIKKPNLRVLFIGNSFTLDSTDELFGLVQASGVDRSSIVVRRLTHGGASFKTWRDIYTNQPGLTGSYQYTAVVDSDWNYETSSDTNSTLMKNVLSKQWDLIIIQQVSTYSGSHVQWEGHGEGGYLKELLNIIKLTNPDSSIGFSLVHSTRQATFSNIAESVQYVKAKYAFDFIIPYGCAIEGLRMSDYNGEHNLTRDDHHLGYGLSQYTAACVTFQILFGSRYGVSVFGNSYRISQADVTAKMQSNGISSTYADGCLAVDDAKALVAQKLAMLAVCDFSVVPDIDNAI